MQTCGCSPQNDATKPQCTPSFETLLELLLDNILSHSFSPDVFLHPDCEKLWPYGYKSILPRIPIPALRKMNEYDRNNTICNSPISYFTIIQLFKPVANAYLEAEQAKTYLNKCNSQIKNIIRGYLCQYSRNYNKNGHYIRKFLGQEHSFDGQPWTIGMHQGLIISAHWNYLDKRSTRTPELSKNTGIVCMTQSIGGMYHGFYISYGQGGQTTCMECNLITQTYCIFHIDHIHQLLSICNVFIQSAPRDKPIELIKPKVSSKISCTISFPHTHECQNRKEFNNV